MAKHTNTTRREFLQQLAAVSVVCAVPTLLATEEPPAMFGWYDSVRFIESPRPSMIISRPEGVEFIESDTLPKLTIAEIKRTVAYIKENAIKGDCHVFTHIDRLHG